MAGIAFGFDAPVSDGIKNGSGQTHDDDGQGDENVDADIKIFHQHLHADKGQHDRNALLQEVELIDGSSQQEE